MMSPALNSFTAAWSKVCIPYSSDCLAIRMGISSRRFSRIADLMVGVFTKTSAASTKPRLSLRLTRRWDIIPVRFAASCALT